MKIYNVLVSNIESIRLVDGSYYVDADKNNACVIKCIKYRNELVDINSGWFYEDLRANDVYMIDGSIANNLEKQMMYAIRKEPLNEKESLECYMKAELMLERVKNHRIKYNHVMFINEDDKFYIANIVLIDSIIQKEDGLDVVSDEQYFKDCIGVIKNNLFCNLDDGKKYEIIKVDENDEILNIEIIQPKKMYATFLEPLSIEEIPDFLTYLEKKRNLENQKCKIIQFPGTKH